jgi:uncharacterized protein YcbK (DUF882 family)
MVVDIHVKNYLLYDLLMYAQEIGFNGIGYYEKDNFLHLLGLEKRGFGKEVN